ncbi:hypothetical protein HDU76_009253 [Blyttiomyces sp. JEL0837]|nr:hypothetical protein HDU76_009253 [Blyttiomyces sp. JEL0837]
MATANPFHVNIRHDIILCKHVLAAEPWSRVSSNEQIETWKGIASQFSAEAGFLVDIVTLQRRLKELLDSEDVTAGSQPENVERKRLCEELHRKITIFNNRSNASKDLTKDQEKVGTNKNNLASVAKHPVRKEAQHQAGDNYGAAGGATSRSVMTTSQQLALAAESGSRSHRTAAASENQNKGHQQHQQHQQTHHHRKQSQGLQQQQMPPSSRTQQQLYQQTLTNSNNKGPNVAISHPLSILGLLADSGYCDTKTVSIVNSACRGWSYLVRFRLFDKFIIRDNNVNSFHHHDKELSSKLADRRAKCEEKLDGVRKDIVELERIIDQRGSVNTSGKSERVLKYVVNEGLWELSEMELITMRHNYEQQRKALLQERVRILEEMNWDGREGPLTTRILPHIECWEIRVDPQNQQDFRWKNNVRLLVSTCKRLKKVIGLEFEYSFFECALIRSLKTTPASLTHWDVFPPITLPTTTIVQNYKLTTGIEMLALPTVDNVKMVNMDLTRIWDHTINNSHFK